MERQDVKTDIFTILSTCMEVFVNLSCLFVHEPLYQTIVVCCNASLRRSFSNMDHHTVFHVRVGLAQAHPNNITHCIVHGVLFTVAKQWLGYCKMGSNPNRPWSSIIAAEAHH